MPTRSTIAAALCAVVVGFFGYRSVVLEQRIDALRRQLGETPAAADPSSSKANVAVSGDQSVSQRARLGELEKGVTSLDAKLRTLRYASGGAPNLPENEMREEILSVVQRESSRVRDVQLDWSRERWQEARDQQLAAFARDYGLSSDQTATMQKGLAHEVDAMVEVLRRPTLFEEPERTVKDWQALRTVTDETAERTLTPAQLQAWNLVREFERKILYPWLPERQTK